MGGKDEPPGRKAYGSIGHLLTGTWGRETTR